MIKRAPFRGYLLVLVAVCVSMLSISFLRLAANSARADDDAEGEVATSAAYYAAESGLLTAELKLASLVSPPPEGQWLRGSLETSGASFVVSVVRSAKPKDGEFAVRCRGQIEVEGNRKVTSILEAEIAQGPDKRWSVRSRKRI